MGCRGGGGEKGGGWRDAAVCTGEQTGRVCVSVCVLGEEGLCQSRWGYILCFMVTRGRINHCFIKWLQSQSAAPLAVGHPSFLSSFSSHPSLLCPPSFSPHTVSHYVLKPGLPSSSITPSTSPLTLLFLPPLSLSLSTLSPPFCLPLFSICTSCHRPSTQARH